MKFYKFIRITGREAKTIGWFIPNLFRFHGVRLGLKVFGLDYLRYILRGDKIWWTYSEDSYKNAVEGLKKLKKMHSFEFYYQ